MEFKDLIKQARNYDYYDRSSLDAFKFEFFVLPNRDITDRNGHKVYSEGEKAAVYIDRLTHTPKVQIYRTFFIQNYETDNKGNVKVTTQGFGRRGRGNTHKCYECADDLLKDFTIISD